MFFPIFPFSSGMYGAEVSRFLPSFRQNDSKSEDTNSFAPTETINLGFPMTVLNPWNFSKHSSLLLKKYSDEARAAICKSNSILMPIDGLLNNRTLNIGVHYIHYFCGHGSTLGTAMRFALVVSHVSQTNYLSFHKHPVYMAKSLSRKLVCSSLQRPSL